MPKIDTGLMNRPNSIQKSKSTKGDKPFVVYILARIAPRLVGSTIVPCRDIFYSYEY
jgi:hypothetical protein